MGLGGKPAGAVGNDIPAGQQNVDTQLVIDEVLRALRRRLTVVNSAVPRDVGTSWEFTEQVRSILQDVRHASREEERRRISRELHDRVGHEMALALQHFDMHRYFTGTDDARAEREFAAGFTSLDEALRTVRHLSTRLRRSVGEDGIEATIESYLQDNVPGGIRASLEITGDAKILSPSICEELYMIMREACRNALRHGHPSEIRLTMTVTDSEVTATVSDNGRGFRVGAPDTPAGGGLPSMTERVELLSGVLKMESTIGEGTTVTVWVPLSDGRVL